MFGRLSFLAVAALFGLSACQMTEPVVEKATTNVISISYDAWDTVPTLTADAIDIAIEHCKSHGKRYANYKGVNVPNALSAKEVHTFACENYKTDDNAVIAAQNERYRAEAAAAAIIISNSIQQAQPTQTSCTTVGYHTTCTTY